MNNNQETQLLYRIISLLFLALVITIIGIDISGKYFQQGIALFSVTSPILFPFLVFLTLLISFILELWSDIKEILYVFAQNGKDEVIRQNKNLLKTKQMFHIFSFIIISVIYIYLLPRLHFIPATSLYMFCIMMVINEKDKFFAKLAKAVLATGITIPIIYYIFYEIFEVILP